MWAGGERQTQRERELDLECKESLAYGTKQFPSLLLTPLPPFSPPPSDNVKRNAQRSPPSHVRARQERGVRRAGGAEAPGEEVAGRGLRACVHPFHRGDHHDRLLPDRERDPEQGGRDAGRGLFS